MGYTHYEGVELSLERHGAHGSSGERVTSMTSRIARIAGLAGIGVLSLTPIEGDAASSPDTAQVVAPSQSSSPDATPAQPDQHALADQIRLIIDAVQMGQLGAGPADRVELVKALQALRKQAAESDVMLSMMKRDHAMLQHEMDALRTMNDSSVDTALRQREFDQREHELSDLRESVSQLTAESAQLREQHEQLFHELQLAAHANAQLVEERETLRRPAAMSQSPRQALTAPAPGQVLAAPEPGRTEGETGMTKPDRQPALRVPAGAEPVPQTPPLTSSPAATAPPITRTTGASRSASGQSSTIVSRARSKATRPPAQPGFLLTIHSVNEELGLVVFDMRGTEWSHTGTRFLLDTGMAPALEVTIDEINPRGLALGHLHEPPSPLPIKRGDRVSLRPQLGP